MLLFLVPENKIQFNTKNTKKIPIQSTQRLIFLVFFVLTFVAFVLNGILFP